MEDIHIFRAAKLLIKDHGEGAVTHAGEHYDKMMKSGNIEVAAVWLRIMKAIHDTQRVTPRSGEQRH